jgi:cyclin B
MLIACKYEEIYAPEVRDFVYITDKAYTKEDILSLEKELLIDLEFNVTVPTTYRFLEVFCRYMNVQENYFMFARYLIELFLIEYKMLKYKPSLIASSVLFITFKVTKSQESQNVCKISNYSDAEMKDCARDICLILNNSEKNSLQAVRKKFSTIKFMEVAKLKFS